MESLSIMLDDTHPEARKLQTQLLRQSSPQRRGTLMCDMTETALALSWRALARAHPELGESDLKLLFVQLHYGRKLADDLRCWLQSRPA
jgi:hypothetical protein